jgi:type II secretory pathway component HofQ
MNYDANPKALVKIIYFPENPIHANHRTKQKTVLFSLGKPYLGQDLVYQDITTFKLDMSLPTKNDNN